MASREKEFLDHSVQNQLWIPPGFAHGFLTLTESVYFEYKCTDYYNAEDEETLIWNDSDLKIASGSVKNPILSTKDSLGKKLKDLFWMNILILGSDGQLGMSYKKISSEFSFNLNFKNTKTSLDYKNQNYQYSKTQTLSLTVPHISNVDGAEMDSKN